MGGLTPLYVAFSQGCIPPQEGCPVPGQPKRTIPFGGNPRGQPFGGVSRAILPKVAPLILGLPRMLLGVFLVAVVPIFTDLYRLSWANILVNSRVLFTVDYLYHVHVFFSDNRPLEELLH